MFPLPTSVADSCSKEMGCSVTELRSSSSPARPNGPMLPHVVRLKGRIGSSVIPLLERSLVQCGQAPYVILDLRAVVAVETSVAEYIQSQVKRYLQSQDEEYIQSQAERILQRHVPLLKIVVPHSRLAVMDLDRARSTTAVI